MIVARSILHESKRNFSYSKKGRFGLDGGSSANLGRRTRLLHRFFTRSALNYSHCHRRIGFWARGRARVFGQLQTSLNAIWDVEPKPGRGILGLVRDRILSFGFILVVGFLLLVSLLLTAAVAVVAQWFGMLPAMEALAQILNFVVSLAVITLLFAMIFKFLPDAKIAWHDVWIGAFITALLFTVGKFALGLYLGKSGVGSSYGAAGSLIVLLLWVYYSSQILFFGAEFTQVYANRFGSHVAPTDNAVSVSKHA